MELLCSRFGATTPAETTTTSHTSADLDTLKHELLTEMRQEMQKVKDEIIHGLCSNTLLSVTTRQYRVLITIILAFVTSVL